MKLKNKIVTLEEYNKNKGKYYIETYTTVRRKGKGCGLFDPVIYRKYERGNLPMSENALIKLSRTNPKTRIGLHGDDGVTVAVAQVRNIRVVINEETK